MVDEAAKKAREEYLKKYLSKDDHQQVAKKHKKKKKKKNVATGLKIYEDDAFAVVAPGIEQSSSEDETEKDVEIISTMKKLKEAPKFKPAAFQSVDIKVESNAIRKRHDSASDENELPDEHFPDVSDQLSFPGTSAQFRKNVPVKLSQNDNTARKTEKHLNSSSDFSLPTRMIKEEPVDSDTSPPRRPAKGAKRNPDGDSDASPPRRRKPTGDSDSDASPPRRSTKGVKRNHDDDSDASPPRRRKLADDSDSDTSLPRRHADDNTRNSSRRKDSEHYRHQKRRRSDSEDSDRHRKNRDNDSDASPPRIRNTERNRREHRGRSAEKSSSKYRYHEGHRRRKDSPESDRSSSGSKRDRSNQRDVKPLTGKSAGLKTLEAHREEMKRLKEIEAKMLESSDKYTSGENAAVVRRPKLTGKGRETKEDRERKEREAKKQQELEEKYKKWNKGIRQIQERTEKLNEMARVAQEDFARHADNVAMNVHMKEQLHEKDPMYNYVRKKKEKAEMKSGIVYPKYQGSWPPNRFNIAPGYRWDGVNRSNGFEDRIAEVANRKAAQRTEYYQNIAKYEV